MVENRKSINNLKPYVPGRPIEDVKREYGLSDVVKIASNENPYGGSPLAVEAAKKSLDYINMYPDGACVELRKELSQKLGVDSESLIFGAGEDEIISMIAQAFIETDDEMVTAEVTFGQCAAAVSAMGGKVVFTKMNGHGFDLDAIVGSITENTKLIYIANPNNPTGTLITDAEKIAFLDKVPENVMVLFDEAYQEFSDSAEFTCSVPLVKKYPQLVVLKTFSKAYGLASLRVGYCVINPSYAKYIEKIRKPFNVSIPAQAAALAALSDDSFLAEVREKNIKVKQYCYEKLNEMGLFYIKSETNFIMADCGKDSMTVFDALMRKGYIIRPGKPFGMETFLRITVGTMEEMVGFFEALKKTL